MNWFKGFIVLVLIGVVFNMFKSEKTGSVDGIQQDFCKDKKCVSCQKYIGCYGYEWDATAGVVIGSDNSLNHCKECAEKRL